MNLTVKLLLSVLALLFLPLTSFTVCADETGYLGWEQNSEYNRLYNPKDQDQLKGIIKEFTTVTPFPGMAPGTAIILDEGGDETQVHLCPESFASAKETGLKKGARVKVKGSWAEIDDEFVFMAAKVKKGDHFEFKVRLTSDGTPFWTMTSEQLAEERRAE